jgi:hypothetical protein
MDGAICSASHAVRQCQIFADVSGVVRGVVCGAVSGIVLDATPLVTETFQDRGPVGGSPSRGEHVVRDLIEVLPPPFGPEVGVVPFFEAGTAGLLLDEQAASKKAAQRSVLRQGVGGSDAWTWSVGRGFGLVS